MNCKMIVDEYGNKIETKTIGNRKYVTVWYKNGNKMCKEEYKNGKEEGKWSGWYGNGDKWYEEEYKDGEREGKWRWYVDGNKMCQEEEYKDGKLITQITHIQMLSKI